MSPQERDLLCACGHRKAEHSGKGHIEDCCSPIDSLGIKFCSCKKFKEHQFKSEEEIEMAKEKKARKKSEGRKPTLAPYVDSPFKIYMTTGGKEYDAQVLSSGVIKIDDKEFTSPSSAGQYLLGNNKKGKPLQVDGWKSWKFNKDGERVPLDVLRGGKSPLKAEVPNKAAKPKKEKKARKPRKPKAPKLEATETQTQEAAA